MSTSELMPRLSIIVISYETREMTLACLRSVVPVLEKLSAEVVVWDNDSKDGSADAIAAEFPQMHLIRSTKNVGFAAANNMAAEQTKGEYLLLLNPDTVVYEGAIERLMAFAEKYPEAGIWGGRTVFADGSLNPMSCWGRPTLWSVACHGVGLAAVFRRTMLFNPESLGNWKRDTVREVDIVTGCFLLIRRELWNRLGGFDQAFFMYGEEADLCLRARKLGARPMICPDATILHYGGASERVRADKVVRLFAAKRQLMERHCTRAGAWFAAAMLRLWALSRAVVLRGASWVQPSRAETADAWSDVWRRRNEWLRDRIEPVRAEPGALQSQRAGDAKGVDAA